MRPTSICTTLALLCLTACAQGTSVGDPVAGSGSTSGTIQGSAVLVAEVSAIAISGADCDEGGGFISTLNIGLSSLAGVCQAVQNSNQLPGTSIVSLEITARGSAQPAAIVPGTYTIANGSDLDVLASYSTYDATCSETMHGDATSGTITLTSVNGGVAIGSFDLQFDSDHLTGTFHSTDCAISMSLYCGTTEAGCGT